MCGRYTLITDRQGIQQRFGVSTEGIDVAPKYNVAPTQEVLVITNEGKGHAELVRWGLVPWWTKDVSVGNRMINLRDDSLEKARFSSMFQKRRCLVLADGFYEWLREGPRRIPLRFVLKSGDLFAFAGLWSVWKSPEGQWMRSCSIITTGPNALMEQVHNRMPVILPRDDEELWIAPGVADATPLLGLLKPLDASEMDAYEVSTLVNSAYNDVPDCIARVAENHDGAKPQSGRQLSF